MSDLNKQRYLLASCLAGIFLHRFPMQDYPIRVLAHQEVQGRQLRQV